MSKLINDEELYTKFAKLEGEAFEHLKKLDPEKDVLEWHKWNALFIERGAFKHDVVNALAIDAVEIVRCKDCQWHEDEEPGMVWCPNITGNWVDQDFFCGYGSRRKGNEMNAKEMLDKVQTLKEQVLLNSFEKTPEVDAFFNEYWLQILDMLDDALYAYLTGGTLK